jgi:hypothetical protein
MTSLLLVTALKGQVLAMMVMMGQVSKIWQKTIVGAPTWIQ